MPHPPHFRSAPKISNRFGSELVSAMLRHRFMFWRARLMVKSTNDIPPGRCPKNCSNEPESFIISGVARSIFYAKGVL